MTITSITIGAVEKISKIQMEGFSLNDETGGRIGVCGFTIIDTHAAIAAIARAEVIVYVGATKIFGGNIGTVEPRWINATESQAQIVCQDYNALLSAVTVPSEAYAAQTDEAILDDLLSTYLPAVSTADVVQVKASVTVIFTNQTLRQCVETLANLTNAEWYIDADKKLQYYDSAAKTANKIKLLQSSGAVVETSTFAGWRVSQCTYAANELNEITSGDTTHWIDTGAASKTFENGEDYVIWFDVKAKERSWVCIYTNATGAAKTAYFDIGNGAIGYTASGITASITEIGDGVYRCMVAFTAGTTSGYCALYIAEADADASYVGVAGYGIYLYGAYWGKGIPFLLAPFTHTEDWQNLCNSVTVVGFTADEGGQFTYRVSADSDDGFVYYTDTSWYPTGGTPFVDTSGDWQVRANNAAGTYLHSCGLVAFDTSAIPDDAVVTAAQLRLCLGTSIVHADGASFGIEWYTVGTIDIGDHTTTFADTAFPEALLAVWASQAPGYMFGLTLTTPTNVNKTGKTGFRLHIKRVSAPTGDNALYIVGGATDANRPQLVVTYTYTPTITETRTDATSIGIYGTFKRTIYDESILTAAQAQLRGDVELARYAYPEEFGNIDWRRDGIKRGDVVRIVSAIHGVDDDYHLARVTTRLDSGVMTYSGQYGRHQPDLINLLRKQAELS